MHDPTLLVDPEGRAWRAPSLASADRERVRWGGFRVFCQLAFRNVKIEGFREARWNWHLDELCNHAQALIRGECTELLVNIPPGHTKSTIFSVLLQPWVWTEDPAHKFMTASFDDMNIARHAGYSVDVLNSPWYVERWGRRVPDATNRKLYYTIAGGYRFTTSVGSKGTGWHGDTYLIDDPLKAQDITYSDDKQLAASLERTQRWVQSSVVTRGADSQQKICLVMQRLHELDTTGQLERAFGKYKSFCKLRLPYLFEPHARCVTPFGGDRRRVKDEILDPRKPRSAIDKIAAVSGGWAGEIMQCQYQQNATPPGGRIFKSPAQPFAISDFPFHQSLSILSVDPTFRAGSGSDYLALQVWGFRDGGLYLYHSHRCKRGFSDTLTAIRAMLMHWPCNHVLVEGKANGDALVDQLEQELANVIKVDPLGGKQLRAKASSFHYDAGKVFWLGGAPWWDELALELKQFPGRHDDQVDAGSQAILWLCAQYGSIAGFAEAMAEAGEEMHGFNGNPGAIFDRLYAVR